MHQSSQRYLFKIRRFPPQAPRRSAGDTDRSCLEYRWLIWASPPRSQNSSYWNTKPACPEIKCCSLRSLKDPTEERGKIERLLRGWPGCGLMGTSSPRTSPFSVGQWEEAEELWWLHLTSKALVSCFAVLFG